LLPEIGVGGGAIAACTLRARLSGVRPSAAFVTGCYRHAVVATLQNQRPAPGFG